MIEDIPDPSRSGIGNHLTELIVDDERTARPAPHAEAGGRRPPDIRGVVAEWTGVAIEAHAGSRINRDAIAATGNRCPMAAISSGQARSCARTRTLLWTSAPSAT
jgi:hypothetical protein